MTPEDKMVLAIDAVKAVEITEASDESLSLWVSLLNGAAIKIYREQANRMAARHNTLENHGEYDVELRTIRGEEHL